MVINKVSGIKEIIEITLADNQHEKITENLTEALKSINELTNWVKFLQIAHDLRLLSSLSYGNKTHEKRKEIRYPLPEIYQKHISLKINVSGSWVPVLLTNFSQRGVQFKCPEPLDSGAVYECVLFTVHRINKAVSFKARIKYCTKHEREFVIGATIEEIADAISFNFFEDVYNFIMEITLQEELKPPKD